jgi:uncharacterized membrane protein
LNTIFQKVLDRMNSKFPWWIIGIFALIYCSISIVNHYVFRTYALDLGLYTQAAYQYAHFNMANSTMIRPYLEPLLGIHFDLYLALFSPLIYVFGTYTLLIVQIIALLLGGVGVYQYFKLLHPKEHGIAVLAMVYFYSFFGVFSAISFDYHSVVVAASIVPWLFIFIRKERFLISGLLLILILISQENISLWMFFVFIGLIIEYRKHRKSLIFLSLFACISLLYFYLVVYHFIPYFSNSNKYVGFAYEILGKTPIEAIQFILTSPIKSIELLFVNHLGRPYFDYIKIEFHIFVVLSGLIFLIKKPAYLLMLVPLYAQKLYHDRSSMWSFGGQYVIEFAPILAIGIFSVMATIKNKNLKLIFSIFLFIGTIGVTQRMMENTIQYMVKSSVRFYTQDHYKRNYNVKRAHEILQLIPKNAKVSSQSQFTSHLALREHIYQFPIISDAEYIIYSLKEGPYPTDQKKFDDQITDLLESKTWVQIVSENDIRILKKIKDLGL